MNQRDPDSKVTPHHYRLHEYLISQDGTSSVIVSCSKVNRDPSVVAEVAWTRGYRRLRYQLTPIVMCPSSTHEGHHEATYPIDMQIPLATLDLSGDGNPKFRGS